MDKITNIDEMKAQLVDAISNLPENKQRENIQTIADNLQIFQDELNQERENRIKSEKKAFTHTIIADVISGIIILAITLLINYLL